MSTQGNGPPLVYSIHLTGKTRELVKQRFLEAVQAGRGPRFLAALRMIVERLRREPHRFGEPLYRLAALKLLVYHGAIAPVVVDYGIHEEKPLVFIRAIQILS
jgi:hypothetical protein